MATLSLSKSRFNLIKPDKLALAGKLTALDYKLLQELAEDGKPTSDALHGMEAGGGD